MEVLYQLSYPGGAVMIAPELECGPRLVVRPLIPDPRRGLGLLLGGRLALGLAGVLVDDRVLRALFSDRVRHRPLLWSLGPALTRLIALEKAAPFQRARLLGWLSQGVARRGPECFRKFVDVLRRRVPRAHEPHGAGVLVPDVEGHRRRERVAQAVDRRRREVREDAVRLHRVGKLD